MRPSPLNPMPTLRTRQNQATAAKDRLQPALLDRLTDHEPICAPSGPMRSS